MNIKKAFLKLADGLLRIQPVLAIPIFFSVLTGTPSYWISLPVALFPVAVRVIIGRRLAARTLFDIPILLSILATVLGVIISDDKIMAAGAAASILASVLIFYGLVGNSHAGNKYWTCVGIIILVISTILTIWFFSQGSNRLVAFNSWVFRYFAGLPKTSGPVLQFNSLGTLLSVLIPGLTAVALYDGRRVVRIGTGILVLIFTFALVLSDSGGGWIAAAFGLAFVLTWRFHRVGLFLLPAYGAIAGFFAYFYHRFAWIPPTFSTGSLMARFSMWSNTFREMSWTQNITGLGLGGWAKTYQAKFGGQPVHVHNSYLQYYADGGIIAVASLVGAAVQFVRASASILHSSRANIWYGVGVGLIGGIIAGAVMAMYDVTTTVTVWTSATTYIYMSVPFIWIWAALLVVAREKLQSSL